MFVNSLVSLEVWKLGPLSVTAHHCWCDPDQETVVSTDPTAVDAESPHS